MTVQNYDFKEIGIWDDEPADVQAALKGDVSADVVIIECDHKITQASAA